MNADPAAELQKAMYAALADAGSYATAAFAAISATRQVFDHVPRGADGAPTKPYPFVAFGHMQALSETPQGEDGTCDDETEVFADIEIWDDAVKRGTMGAKALASAVKKDLGRVLTVVGFSVSVGHARQVRHLTENGGVARSIVTLRYLMDPA